MYGWGINNVFKQIEESCKELVCGFRCRGAERWAGIKPGNHLRCTRLSLLEKWQVRIRQEELGLRKVEEIETEHWKPWKLRPPEHLEGYLPTGVRALELSSHVTSIDLSFHVATSFSVTAEGHRSYYSCSIRQVPTFTGALSKAGSWRTRGNRTGRPYWCWNKLLNIFSQVLTRTYDTELLPKALEGGSISKSNNMGTSLVLALSCQIFKEHKLSPVLFCRAYFWQSIG